MPILAYILLFIGLAIIAFGFVVKAGGASKIPGYKPDPNVEVREDELVRFATKNIVLIGIVDAIVAIAMIAIGDDNYIVFLATLAFTAFIFYAVKYASKVMVVPK